MNIKCYKLLFWEMIYVVMFHCHVQIQGTQLSVNSWVISLPTYMSTIFILFILCFYLTPKDGTMGHGSYIIWKIISSRLNLYFFSSEYSRSFHVGIIIFGIITLSNYLYVIKCRMRIVNRTNKCLASSSTKYV